ncbi:MAG: hypothetical protein M3R24_03460 [Chloroflexota bacterium]|nr:hypothetical protein [Chloroflexota bacterium]
MRQSREVQESTVQTWVALGALYIAAFAGVITINNPFAHFVFACAGLLIALFIFYNSSSADILSGVLQAMVIIAGGVVLSAAAVSLYLGYNLQSEIVNQQNIRETILNGTQAELNWYKDPQNDHLPELERYFLPANPSQPNIPKGARLPQIENFIQTFRNANERYADTASRALFFNQVSILPDGVTANVETSEIWYQPRVQGTPGNESNVQQEVSQLNLYSDKQFYILREINGTWYIESNPAPVAPGS